MEENNSGDEVDAKSKGQGRIMGSYFTLLNALAEDGIPRWKTNWTFADMKELRIRPTNSIIQKVGNVFLKLGMLDKHEKLKRKYPPPKWEYQYIKGKHIRVRSKQNYESNGVGEPTDQVYEENVESDDDMNRSDEGSSKQLTEFLDLSRLNPLKWIKQVNKEPLFCWF